MPTASMSASTKVSGSSSSTSSRARAAGSSSASNAVGQIVDRSGLQRLDLGERVVRFVQPAVEGELPGLLDVAAQLAVQVAQRQVGQVEGALVGTQQVRRRAGCRW